MDRFDRWALRRARSGATDLDRRDLLRRAGVVGAVVAVSPLIESVGSPAYAVSCVDPSDPVAMCGGSTCPPCANGSICTSDSDCTSKKCTTQFGGGVCQTNVVNCSGGSASNKTKDENCTSGYCERTSNVCTEPLPTALPGRPCHGKTQAVANANCASGTCANWSEATYEGTCAGAV